MPIRFPNPFSLLFPQTRHEQHVERYVLRELSRGRPLGEVVEDHYVRNRTSEAQRARLLDRPEIVAAAARAPAGQRA